MNKRTLRLIPLSLVVLMIMATTGCGIRYTVTGTVVDMDTGKPVEGAVVSILWTKDHIRPPGMGTSYEVLELADYSTGADGKFIIPKYTFRDFHLAVYKKGYVCWSNEKFFPDFRERVGFKLKNNMTIELEPFRSTYSKKDHAYWVKTVVDHNLDWGHQKGKLFKATEEERALYKKEWGDK